LKLKNKYAEVQILKYINYSTLVCQNQPLTVAIVCYFISKVFQGTFFYHTTIEQGRTTHHAWVNEHPNDSKYGLLTKHWSPNNQSTISYNQTIGSKNLWLGF
jgi:hypothetical protein